MGGCGSGQYYRQAGRDKVEDYRRIDVSSFIRGKLNSAGLSSSGNVNWSCDGEVVSRINYKISANDEAGTLKLSYTIISTGQYYDYPIRLCATKPHLGGLRWWFICPAKGCGRRVGILYESGTIYACRHCLNLAYESQNLPAPDRIIKKLHKVQGRIEDYYGIIKKPKGMHNKTYQRLFNKWLELEMLSENMLLGKFGKYL